MNKAELKKFRIWWNENKSQLSVRISLNDIDVYLENLPKTKTENIDYSELLIYISNCTGRKFRVINKSVRLKMNARLREGYKKRDIVRAIKNACSSDYHKENGFQHLTPEFFSRASTLDKYGFQVNEKTLKKEQPKQSLSNNIPVE